MALKKTDLPTPEKMDPAMEQRLRDAQTLLEKHGMMPKVPESNIKPRPDGLVALELAIYKRYVEHYRNEKGEADSKLYTDEEYYLFTPEQAALLLRKTEDNTGRPIWRRYRSPVDKNAGTPVGEKRALNATKDRVQPDRRDPGELAAQGVDVIEIGSEDEISDILGAVAADTDGVGV